MSSKDKQLLFTLTKKDFKMETFRAGGKGGQNQNKRDTGVRIRHPASGAVGESRNHRTQGKNKQAAFLRLIESQKFKVWHKMEVARCLRDSPSVEETVEEMMRPENLKVDIKDEDGNWTPCEVK